MIKRQAASASSDSVGSWPDRGILQLTRDIGPQATSVSARRPLLLTGVGERTKSRRGVSGDGPPTIIPGCSRYSAARKRLHVLHEQKDNQSKGESAVLDCSQRPDVQGVRGWQHTLTLVQGYASEQHTRHERCVCTSSLQLLALNVFKICDVLPRFLVLVQNETGIYPLTQENR